MVRRRRQPQRGRQRVRRTPGHVGYTMYDISERALTPGEVLGRKLEAFDAEATEILAVPRMVAG
jgi:hypothetical protein